jgi:hypothetical protein
MTSITGLQRASCVPPAGKWHVPTPSLGWQLSTNEGTITSLAHHVFAQHSQNMGSWMKAQVPFHLHMFG